MSGPVLRIRELSVSFPMLVGAVRAVRACALEIARGEIVGLVGESGSGKSVTASACLGLVPPPGEVTGSIEVQGREVVGRTDAELTKLRGGEAAMIFQNPGTALNPFFTVGQQLSDIVGRKRRLTPSEARARVLQALGDVRIPDPEVALERYPHQMSGGQLQRVMIALAIACEPALLIADEPTTALDVTVQAQIIVLLRELAQEKDLAVLFITHDLGVVAALCDRVAVMYAGAVVETGEVTDIFDAPAHPYTAKLLQTVPRLGAGAARLEAIPGQVPDLSRLPRGCPFQPRCGRASAACQAEEPLPRHLPGARMVACHHVMGEAQGGDSSLGGVA